MPSADVNGTTLAYELRGGGVPLLLVQGLSGTQDSWGDAFLAGLEAEGFSTLRYDHRGVGRSARDRTAFTTAQLAEDAAALMDAVGWADANVLGVSMGGMVAQELALAHPRRVRSIALAGTSPGGCTSLPTPPEVVESLTAAVMSGDRERVLRAGYEANVSPTWAADPRHWPPYRAMARAARIGLDVLMRQMRAIDLHDAAGRLAAITVPTLVIHGTADRMLPVANAHAMAAAIPGARLELLPEVGHLLWWERPARTAALLARLAGR